MTFRSNSMKLNLCKTPGGVAAILVMVLCALFTFATVDFGASNSPQRSLDWLLGSESGQITTDGHDHAWDTRKHLPPPSQLPENVSSTVGSQRETAPELAEIAHPAPSPIEESIASGAGWDHVDYVKTAPSPIEESVASVAGGLDDVDKVETAPTPSEEFDDSGDRDPVEEIVPSSVESETVPSSVEESDESSMNMDPDEERAQESGASIKWNYDVCLLVTMGRSWVRTDRQALPYAELYRLFNAAKSAPNGSAPWNGLRERKLFVGTNLGPTIFCKMVRDALGPSVQCSNFNRVGVTTNTCEHLVLGATEKYTQQSSPGDLQKYNFLWDTMETVDLDTEDPARQPPSLSEAEWRPTIVTTFSSNHVEVGLLLLRSLGRVAAQQNEYNVSVVVWTMNHFPSIAQKALACVVEELQTVYKVQTEVRAFDFDAWPPWMRINQKKGYNGGRGEYAWKAVMIHTVLVERGFVYWADAGDRFRSVAGLTQTLRHVKLKGFASRHSSGHVKDWTHPMQLEYFGANNAAIKKQLNCDASGIGFTLRRYSELARPWYECSITRQCIAPDGSSRKNHRQDQSALTVLAILTGSKCEGVDSGITKNMDSQPNSHTIGVDATKCYKDPLHIKWQR